MRALGDVEEHSIDKVQENLKLEVLTPREA